MKEKNSIQQNRSYQWALLFIFLSGFSFLFFNHVVAKGKYKKKIKKALAQPTLKGKINSLQKIIDKLETHRAQLLQQGVADIHFFNKKNKNRFAKAIVRVFNQRRSLDQEGMAALSKLLSSAARTKTHVLTKKQRLYIRNTMLPKLASPTAQQAMHMGSMQTRMRTAMQHQPVTAEQDQYAMYEGPVPVNYSGNMLPTKEGIKILLAEEEMAKKALAKVPFMKHSQTSISGVLIDPDTMMPTKEGYKVLAQKEAEIGRRLLMLPQEVAARRKALGAFKIGNVEMAGMLPSEKGYAAIRTKDSLIAREVAAATSRRFQHHQEAVSMGHTHTIADLINSTAENKPLSEQPAALKNLLASIGVQGHSFHPETQNALRGVLMNLYNKREYLPPKARGDLRDLLVKGLDTPMLTKEQRTFIQTNMLPNV